MEIEQTHALVGIGQVFFVDSSDRILTAESTADGSEFSLVDFESEDELWLIEEPVDALPLIRVGYDRIAYPARGRFGGDRIEVRRIADFELSAHFGAGVVTAMAADPDGRTIAAADDQGAVVLWESATGTLVRRVIETKNAVEQLAFSADGCWIAVRDIECKVLINRIDASTDQAAILGTNDGTAIVFHPQKLELVVDIGNSLAIYDVEAGQQTRVLDRVDGDNLMASELCFSPDGALLLAGSFGDGALDIWEFNSGKYLGRIGTLGDHVFSLNFHAEGNHFAACRHDAGAIFEIERD